MVVLPFVDVKDGINELIIRFEIFLLIPYLYELLKIRKEWESLNETIKTDSNIYESVQTNLMLRKKLLK